MTAYETALAQLDAYRASVEAMRPELELLESIRDEIRPDAEVKLNKIGFDEANIELAVDDLREVIPVLRRIRAAGHVLLHHADCPETNTRLYIFKTIRVDVVLRGASCRFEKIGVEERPVYSVICGDGVSADNLHTEFSAFEAVRETVEAP